VIVAYRECSRAEDIRESREVSGRDSGSLTGRTSGPDDRGRPKAARSVGPDRMGVGVLSALIQDWLIRQWSGRRAAVLQVAGLASAVGV